MYSGGFEKRGDDEARFFGHTFVVIPDSGGVEFIGELKDGIPLKGALYDKEGSAIGAVTTKRRYVGERKDGERHGKGTSIDDDGSKYVGEWKDGKKHGQGTYTWANGDKYVGEYKDGKRHGQGTMTYADGGKYVGEFKDGRQHGQGTGRADLQYR